MSQSSALVAQGHSYIYIYIYISLGKNTCVFHALKFNFLMPRKKLYVFYLLYLIWLIYLDPHPDKHDYLKNLVLQMMKADARREHSVSVEPTLSGLVRLNPIIVWKTNPELSNQFENQAKKESK